MMMISGMFIKCSICHGLIMVSQMIAVISWTLLLMFASIDQELWSLPSYIAGTLLLPVCNFFVISVEDICDDYFVISSSTDRHVQIYNSLLCGAFFQFSPFKNALNRIVALVALKLHAIFVNVCAKKGYCSYTLFAMA
jgi:hypothetical protein